MNSRYSTRAQERRAISPITRPAPLPSIPRPSTATPAATAAAKERVDQAPTLATRQANARRGDGGGGRGVSPTPASTTKPAAAVAEAIAVLPVQKGDREVGGKKRPEAVAWGDENDNRKASDATFPPAVVDGAGAASPGDKADSVNAAGKKATAAISKPEPDAREGAPPAVTASHTPERPGSLGVASGPRQGRAVGNAKKSTSGQDRQPTLKGSVSMTAARRDGDGGFVVPPSHSSAEQNLGDPAGALGVEKVDATTVAPAGSLARLKRRRQQAKTRSNSQR